MALQRHPQSLAKLWTPKAKKQLKKLLRYKFVSVRDEFTKEFILENTTPDVHAKIKVVPDPTFYIDHSKYFQLSRKLKQILTAKYVLLDLSNKQLSKNFKDIVKGRFPGHRIVSPMANRFADIILR